MALGVDIPHPNRAPLVTVNALPLPLLWSCIFCAPRPSSPMPWPTTSPLFPDFWPLVQGSFGFNVFFLFNYSPQGLQGDRFLPPARASAIGPTPLPTNASNPRPKYRVHRAALALLFFFLSSQLFLKQESDDPFSPPFYRFFWPLDHPHPGFASTTVSPKAVSVPFVPPGKGFEPLYGWPPLPLKGDT